MEMFHDVLGDYNEVTSSGYRPYVIEWYICRSKHKRRHKTFRR
ncbi:hypothetical protein VCRA2120E57_40082 [Vibrio crassostreae]|nr:hypothetical protein VCRA2120E57_40082 [Vibrio crassostreae]